MTYVKSFKDLIVWQKSVQLVKETYFLTNKFPKNELHNLIPQMRRAATSIPSNIAEGYGRKSIGDYSRYYKIAYGSILELETQVIISKELKLAQTTDFDKMGGLLVEVSKMLNSMTSKMKKLKASS